MLVYLSWYNSLSSDGDLCLMSDVNSKTFIIDNNGLQANTDPWCFWLFNYFQSEDEDEGLAVYLIAIIVILACLCVAALVGIIVWRCSIKPKAKTHGMFTYFVVVFGSDVFVRSKYCCCTSYYVVLIIP